MAVSFLLVSEIMLGQCSLHESNSNIDCGPIFGKNTSFNQVFMWFDVNLPDVEAVMKILDYVEYIFLYSWTKCSYNFS